MMSINYPPHRPYHAPLRNAHIVHDSLLQLESFAQPALPNGDDDSTEL